MTTEQNFYVKTLKPDDDRVTIYKATSGDEFKVRPDMVNHYLSKVKKRTKFVGGSLQTYGDYIPVFVRTKEEIIGSPSSSMTEGVAPQSQVKAGKRRRGRRGKKK
jgi:hypothetical protein